MNLLLFWFKADSTIFTETVAYNHDVLYDRLGIKAVWNFTPFRIRVPEDIVVQNTSLYAHLAVMFNRLNFNEIR